MVRTLGLGLDVGRGDKIPAILQQADGRLLLRLPASEAGGVLVVIVRLFFVGGQCDLEFPVGSILDGADRKAEIGFDSNIHSFCVLWRRRCLFSSVKIHKYVSNSDKICNFALEKNVGCLSSAIPRYRKTR